MSFRRRLPRSRITTAWVDVECLPPSLTDRGRMPKFARRMPSASASGPRWKERSGRADSRPASSRVAMRCRRRFRAPCGSRPGAGRSRQLLLAGRAPGPWPTAVRLPAMGCPADPRWPAAVCTAQPYGSPTREAPAGWRTPAGWLPSRPTGPLRPAAAPSAAPRRARGTGPCAHRLTSCGRGACLHRPRRGPARPADQSCPGPRGQAEPSLAAVTARPARGWATRPSAVLKNATMTPMAWAYSLVCPTSGTHSARACRLRLTAILDLRIKGRPLHRSGRTACTDVPRMCPESAVHTAAAGIRSTSRSTESAL